MKKRVISLILAVLFVIVSAPASVVFATESKTGYSVTADKITAVAGDEIDFSVKLDLVKKMTAFEFTLDIPKGLTLVSGSQTAITAEKLGFEKVNNNESALHISGYGSEPYTASGTLTLATFKCTVDSGSVGKYTVGLIDTVLNDDEYEEEEHSVFAVDITVNCNHSFNFVKEEKPTCKVIGWDAYNECSKCHKLFGIDGITEIFSVPYKSLGNHTGGTTVKNKKSATCTKAGYTGDTYCNTCGKKIKAGTSIKALGHKYTNKVTKATLTKNGKIVPTCSRCKATKTATTVYYPKTIKLSATSYTYDGKVKKPTVKVTGSNGKAIVSSNYTVKYSNNKDIGTAKVIITFKGNYSGTKNLTFKINPKNPTVTVKSAKKKATISYKKISGGVKYQIQYSTKKSSGFKNVKTNTTALKVTKSGLKSKKTYYFRVRVYKKVGKTTYYSGWVTKSVKIK